ncbi:MAG: hypothetical protein QOI14_538, partial [Actinomycetota bacterium]|nr:hypothetical protein [Actinomycetota bacterium]
VKRLGMQLSELETTRDALNRLLAAAATTPPR